MCGHIQIIKDTLDVKFGPTWHCVVGQSFSYEITHEASLSIRDTNFTYNIT